MPQNFREAFPQEYDRPLLSSLQLGKGWQSVAPRPLDGLSQHSGKVEGDFDDASEDEGEKEFQYQLTSLEIEYFQRRTMLLC